jgi:hypothetical protein
MRRAFWPLFALIVGFALGGSVVSTFNQPAPSQTPQQASANTDRQEPNIFSWRAVTVSNVLIAFFTGCLGFVAFLQYRALIDTNKSARTAAEAAEMSAKALANAESAHVFLLLKDENLSSFVKQLPSHPKAAADFAAVGEKFDDIDLTVTYVFKNYGKTPAIIKEISHHVIIAGKLPDEPAYVQIDPMPNELVIPADAESEVIKCRMKRVFYAAEASALLKNRASIYFFGRIVYDDVAGNTHDRRHLRSASCVSPVFSRIDLPKNYTSNS